MGIIAELNSLSPDFLVSLFEFDTLPIVQTPTGLDSVYYINQDIGGLSGIPWGGNLYRPFPFEFAELSRDSTGSALPRPTLTVSNISKTFFSIFLTLGDLSGVRVKRTVTCYKYTDGQPEASVASYLSFDEFTVVRKMTQNKMEIVYELATALDRPEAKLPRRQILRDKTLHNLYAPGVSRIRLR